MKTKILLSMLIVMLLSVSTTIKSQKIMRWINDQFQSDKYVEKISYLIIFLVFQFIIITPLLQAQTSSVIPTNTVVQTQGINDYLEDRLYVVYKTNVPVFWGTDFRISPTAFLEFKDLISEYGITEVENSFYFAQHEVLKRTVTIKFKEKNKINQLLNKLSESPRLELVEKVPACIGSLVPNDPSYVSQWHLSHIGAASAWNTTTGSSSIDVAVVDDAIEVSHPDLSSNITTGRDVAYNTNNPSPPTSSYAHGTHVAGIVGAQSNNGLGVASIGYNVDIMPIKASDGTPAPNGGVYITHGYQGITWAAQNGAEIINCSWGGSGCSTCQTVITNAWSLGAIIVAAAGNDNSTTPSYPAAYSNVIAVASSANTADARSSFSNYGSWVDITAPGSNILSTTLGGNYASWNGTSMASPMVAGLLGLVWSANLSASRTSVINCVTSTAVPLTWTGGGSGRINAAAAVQCAASGGGGGSLPDLGYAGSGASLSVSGTNVSVIFPVSNIGTVSASSSTLKYYLSLDANVTTSDYEIGSDPVSTLAPGVMSTESITVDVSTVSPSIPAGTYYIGVFIDANSTVTESDETNNGLSWTSPQVTITGGYCSGTTNLTGSSGSFSDGSGTSDYNNNADCKWLIQPAGASSVTLSFSSFATESCCDRVRIYDGTTTSAPLLATYAGTSLPPSITSTGGDMLVYFTTDGSVTAAGWSASYTSGSGSSLPDLGYAGSGASMNVLGTVVDIVFPVSNVGTGSAGSSTLKYYLSSDINITTSDYEIGSDAVSSLTAGAMSTESITIDVATISPSIPAGTYYIGVYIDANSTVTESNEANNGLYWQSSQVTLTGGGSGGYCSGTTTLTSATGSFSDGSGTSNYSNNGDCKWLIQPTGATAITLNFSSFALETCCDYVKIYDGTTTSAPLLGSYNGTSLPPSITSTVGSLLVHFTTDGSVTAAGWSASYTSNTGGGGSGIVIGTSLDSNTANGAGPINIWYRSLRYQTVYTAAEFTAAGATAGNITELGWNVLSAPLYNLPNYTISIKHTTTTDASTHDGTGLTQVYTNTSYAPTPGGFDMLTFQTPFVWNGTDNILIDVCFDQVSPTYNASGVTATYAAVNGARYIRADGSSQCGGTTSTSLTQKPQVKLTMNGGGSGSCPAVSGTTLPFTEDFESNTGTFTGNQNVDCHPSYKWDFITSSQTNGRVRLGTDAYAPSTGTGAATLDVITSGATDTNYLTLTLDLSNYTSSTGLELGFDFADFGDEPSSHDRVWIRGSSSGTWLEIYDWSTTNSSSFTTVSGLDIDALLSANGQTVSSTFQVRFGQMDNFPAPTDGLGIDNVTITENNSTTCNTPTGLASSNVTSSSVTLSWNSVTGASLYNIQWRVSGTSTWSNGNTTATSFVPLSINSGTTYQWRVRTDCGSSTSAWSSVQTFTTLSSSFLTVSPTSISPTNAAGNTSINVSSNISWTASESVSWLSISGGSGSNNGSFTISYTANTSTSPRTATVTVTGTGVSNQTITVTQAGTTVTNFLTVNPTSISPASSAGNTSIAVSSNVSWSASESVSWLSLSGGSGSNNGSFTINFTANTSTSPRTATVIISGSGVSNQTITVTQAGASSTPPFTWFPTNQSGVFIGQAEVAGIPTNGSDWIAAFDQNGNIAGASQIVVNAGVGYINLPIYGDDPTTPAVDEGMSAGEYFTLKLYDASTGTYRDYPTTATKFHFTQWSNTNGTPISGYDSPSAVYNFLETVADTIILNAGWNLVSTDVIPSDSTISNVFADIISDNNLIYVTGFDNGTKFYDPNGLPFFNTLNNLKRGLGIWVKVTAADTLIVHGYPLASTFKSNLNAGWNLVSYTPQNQATPSAYYTNLISTNNLIYVTAFNNGTKFYDPNGLSFFNTLTYLRNSFGYWVKVNTSVGGVAYRGNGFLPTNLYDFFNGESNLQNYVGEEVIILTQAGDICGKLMILENGHLMTTAVYGDDLLTNIVDGIATGEQLLFEFRGQVIDVGVIFNGNMQLHYLDLQFDTDNLTNVDGINLETNAFNCYPNPFTSVLNIDYSLVESAETVIRVYNTLGQEIKVIKNEKAVAGEHNVQWNASQESLGFYYISLEINGQVISSRKVLLNH